MYCTKVSKKQSNLETKLIFSVNVKEPDDCLSKLILLQAPLIAKSDQYSCIRITIVSDFVPSSVVTVVDPPWFLSDPTRKLGQVKKIGKLKFLRLHMFP
jgi:hypothetical protein